MVCVIIVISVVMNDDIALDILMYGNEIKKYIESLRTGTNIMTILSYFHFIIIKN